mgnify:CR=1 FL=1
MQIRWLKERKEFQKKIEAHETILKTIQAVTTNEPGQDPSPTSQIKVTEDSFKDRLEKVMDKYVSDENFNVTVMTKELGMSRTALFTKIKNVYGISPQTYITNYRLSKAAELLKAKEQHDVTFCWVKGHAGHPQNERCDELATTAADGNELDCHQDPFQ